MAQKQTLPSNETVEQTGGYVAPNSLLRHKFRSSPMLRHQFRNQSDVEDNESDESDGLPTHETLMEALVDDGLVAFQTFLDC